MNKGGNAEVSVPLPNIERGEGAGTFLFSKIK